MTVIRIANSNDLDQLVGLVEQYRAFYKQDSNVKTKEFLTDRFTNNEAVIFVAELNNQLVGFTLCYPSFSTVSLSRVWLLNDLFVDPTYRGQHIADQLMQAAESAAKSAGASRIWLRTAHTNTPAQGLYEGRGWKQDEVFRRYDLIF
jgi:ribosomal protein S18 acetylase RimI-like enzyme